jgi:hypothetical protein
MPTKKKASSRRELIEPTKGDKRYVRRNAKGEFNKVVDVGKSLSADKRRTLKPRAMSNTIGSTRSVPCFTRFRACTA